MCPFGRKLPLTLVDGVNRIFKMSLQQIAVQLDGPCLSFSGLIPRMSAFRSESCTGPTCSNGTQLVAGNSQIASITGPLQRLTHLVDDDSVLGKYIVQR